MVDYMATLKRLESYYAHSRKYNELEAEAIVNELERKNFTEHQLNQLYNTVIAIYEHLPKLVNINKVLKDPETAAYDKPCDIADKSLGEGRLMSMEKIIQMCRSISEKSLKRELNNTETDFLHRWCDLVYCYDTCMFAWKDELRTMRYCDAIREQILAGGRPNFDALPVVKPSTKAVYERRNDTVSISEVLNVEELF